jgi:hypothetical protein
VRLGIGFVGDHEARISGHNHHFVHWHIVHWHINHGHVDGPSVTDPGSTGSGVKRGCSQ